MEKKVTEWWLVRHAETVNPKKIVYGKLDLDIDIPTKTTCKALSEILPKKPVWIATDLLRTQKTLNGILSVRGYADAEVNIEPAFAEQNFGEWEGRSSAEVWKQIKKSHKSWPADIRPPGGETFSEVAERVKTAALSWSKIMLDRQVVAVLHAGSIRSFLSAAMGSEPTAALSYSIDNLSITKCDFFPPDKWRIGFVNRVVK